MHQREEYHRNDGYAQQKRAFAPAGDDGVLRGGLGRHFIAAFVAVDALIQRALIHQQPPNDPQPPTKAHRDQQAEHAHRADDGVDLRAGEAG